MAVFAVYRDIAHQWRWRFVTDDNRVIAASSESYDSLQDCLSSIRLVKADGRGASVLDLTQRPPAIVPDA